MQLQPTIAIDFGSETIRAARAGRDIFSAPAVVVREVESGRLMAVGEAAAEYSLGKGEELVRPVREGRMVAYTPAVALLKYVLGETLAWWQVSRPQVLLAKSGFVSSAREEVLGEISREAGSGTLFAADTVVLAGFGAEIDPGDPTGQLVVDIGRETTEAAIISRGSLVHSACEKVGGSDLASSLVAHVQDRYDAELPGNSARRAIREVGSAIAPDHDEAIELFVTDTNTTERRELVLTSSEIAEAVKPVLSGIGDVIAAVIKEAPTTLLSDVTERGLLLTGGVANLAHIDTYFRRQFSLPARVPEVPEEAVIRGGREALSFISLYKQSMPQ